MRSFLVEAIGKLFLRKMSQIEVYPLPSFAEANDLQNVVAVVIDVLRATTVTVSAVAAGVRDVLPMLDIEQARQRKAELEARFGTNSVILGGERNGLPINGFDLGNSPQHYTAEKVGGKILILTTTNGTAAMAAAKQATSIYAAALLNAHAVVEQIQNENRIAIICAGTDGDITDEDLLLAGCLVSRLTRKHSFHCNTQAEIVRRLWEECFFTGVEEFVSVPILIECLRNSCGGKNLVHLGLDADIVAAAQIDSINLVPKISLSQKF
jgi:2-phosphosulfolactate phosphatase